MKLFLIFLAILPSCSAISRGSKGLPEQRPSAASLALDPVFREASLKKPRKLCVFMDGTANDHDSQTHVRHLYELVSGEAKPNIICLYDPGVGSETKKVAGKVGGGGFTENLREAYAFLSSYYRPGDQIYIFGYSRGGRSAQVLADMVCRCGLPEVSAPQSKKELEKVIRAISPIVKEYKDSWKSANDELDLVSDVHRVSPPSISIAGNRDAVVEVLGVWDNVDSLYSSAVRMSKNGRTSRYARHRSYSYTRHPGIKRSYHAAALDEGRAMYEVVPMFESGNHSGVSELVWFSGTHGDVGGSYDLSEGLSRHSLNWMLKKLKGTGLVEREDLNLMAFSNGVSVDQKHRLSMRALNRFRKDRYRRSALWGDFWGNETNPKVKVRPKIHWSVLERIRKGNVIVQQAPKSIRAQDRGLPYLPPIFLNPDPDEPQARGYPHIEIPNPTPGQLVAWIRKNCDIVEK